MQNFMVRVKITYKATRAFKIDDRFEQILRTKKGYLTLAKNLKLKIKKIHKDIDNFSGEGMNHLRNFERKLLNKRIKMRKWDKRTKPFPNEQNPLLKTTEQK